MKSCEEKNQKIICMKNKVIEDSGSEIFHFNINLYLGDFSCFMGTTIAQSLFHFIG